MSVAEPASGLGSGAASTDATGVPTGNTYDKHGATNPVVRAIVDRFGRTLDGLLDLAAPRSILDVGCGEGVLTQRWARRYAGARVVGVDLDDAALRADWATRHEANLSFAVADAATLGFEDASFDVVCAIEALEHVPDPAAVLGQMRRCARQAMVVSVPREPLWRALNVARGAYLRDLGNTPGHLNHWSRRSFITLLERYGEVAAVRSPLPWTMLLVRI